MKKKNKHGRMIILDKEIVGKGEYENNHTLTQVHGMGAVREIRERAFAGCDNLEIADLDGCKLEEIGERAFADCPKLRAMTIPDGTFVSSYVYQGCTGLIKPVFDRFGKVLYAYPVSREEKQYMVPSGVTTVNYTAFLENTYLEEVVLPEGVTQICFKAFCDCPAIRKVVIPASVNEIPREAFFNCPQLETVILKGDTRIAFNAFAGASENLKLVSEVRHIRPHERYWALGTTFLEAVPVELPVCSAPEDNHLDDYIFLSMAEDCSAGNAMAMSHMASYFAFLYYVEEQQFYNLASNFWYFMAFLAGDPDAEKWYSQWEEHHPDSRLPAVLDESRSGKEINGSIFRNLGYLYFQENVRYDVWPTSNFGITLICSHPYDDGGFWEITQYNITYLDEYLNELPIDAIYHDPRSKPDMEACAPELIRLMGEAIKASHKRNWQKRMGKPWFRSFG